MIDLGILGDIENEMLFLLVLKGTYEVICTSASSLNDHFKASAGHRRVVLQINNTCLSPHLLFAVWLSCSYSITAIEVAKNLDKVLTIPDWAMFSAEATAS